MKFMQPDVICLPDKYECHSMHCLLTKAYWLTHPEAEFRIKASDNIGYMYQGLVLVKLEAAIKSLHAQMTASVSIAC